MAAKLVVLSALPGSGDVVGAQQRRTLSGVSSMPLKGAVRRKEVSERLCLTKTWYGESI
jgi:hypothetical protein